MRNPLPCEMLNLINKSLRSALLPSILKYLSLGIFIVLLIMGFSASSDDEALLLHLRNTNAGNLIVWSYWWPAIVLLAIFFGRIWCMICPVEIITSLAAQRGLQRKRPEWLLSGWTITIFYLIILFIGIQGIAIHRNPSFMAIYLLAIAGVSILTGLIWEKNTFCRYVCPVGYLLGIYSRFSFLGWRVKDQETCKTCRDKSCIGKRYRYNMNVKSCGVDLFPPRIQSNTDCILCAGCLKSCDRHRSEPASNRPNPGFRHIGFARDLFRLSPLKIPEMAFLLILSGFVISEIWIEWDSSAALLRYIPSELAGWISLTSYFGKGLIYSVMLFLALPIFFWLTPFLAVRTMGYRILLMDYLLTYGLAFLPVIAAAHLVKAILKTTSRIPYIRHLADDPSGMNTAQMILSGEIKLPAQPDWIRLIVSIIITLVMAAGIWISVRVITKINALNPNNVVLKIYYLIPVLYGGIFLGMILAWRWLS